MGMRWAVLFVDDDELARRYFAAAVETYFPLVRTVIAESAQEALAVLSGDLRDEHVVVVADLDLGSGPSGADLLRQVKALRPDAPRFLYTGTPREALPPGAGLVAHAYASKERGPGPLLEFIAGIIERGPPADPPA